MTGKTGVTDFESRKQLALELVQSWSIYVDAQELTAKDMPVERFFTAFGLSSHAHRLARAAFMLLDDGLVLESIPPIRTMFECALTAQWVAQVDGAVEAFFNAQDRSRRNVLEELKLISWAAGLEPDIDQARQAMDEIEKRETNAWPSFKAICEDLTPGGAEAYLSYRVMSQTSHASAMLMDHYFELATDGPVSVRRRFIVAQPDRDAWSSMALCTLVWAGQAVEYAIPGRPRRSQIQAAARTLGIPHVLRPSHTAWKRG